MTRLDELAARREALLDAMGAAHMNLMAAREELYDALDTPQEADKQAELSRAEAAYSAAESELDDWLKSPDGVEWNDLDALA